MARRIPLPRLTRRQRRARWQRERRQQAFIVVIFSAVLFFVLGLISWAASDKFYQDNLKPALRFEGRAVAMRDWKSEVKYEQTRFYVEFGVPAGYENDPQIAQQKASFERSSLDALVERSILDSQARADGVAITPDAIDARYQDDWGQFRSRHILIQINKDAPDQTVEDIKGHTRYDLLKDEYTKRRQDQAVASPTTQVHVAQIQVAAPRPVGGDFQAFTDQLKKVSDVGTALDNGTDFGEVAKKYSEDSATKDKGGDMGWIARGMLTDLAAENELFKLDSRARSPQHNALTTPAWFKGLEK